MSNSNRRDFLQQTAGAAAGMALATSNAETAQQNTQTALPTIRLGTHPVTRLIIGGNPIYGYSHFNRLLGQHQTAWHTPERVTALLKRCEQAGLNTWQNSYAERTLADLKRYRNASTTRPAANPLASLPTEPWRSGCTVKAN